MLVNKKKTIKYFTSLSSKVEAYSAANGLVLQLEGSSMAIQINFICVVNRTGFRSTLVTKQNKPMVSLSSLFLHVL